MVGFLETDFHPLILLNFFGVKGDILGGALGQ
jgi:hypothetical protein